MSKNIEIQINTGSAYEVLYPKIDLTNNQGTSLPLSSTSGNLAANRLSAGTLSGSFTFGSTVSGKTPTSSAHLTTKNYVDSLKYSQIQKISYTGNGTNRITVSFTASSKTLIGFILASYSGITKVTKSAFPIPFIGFDVTEAKTQDFLIWSYETDSTNQFVTSVADIKFNTTSVTVYSNNTASKAFNSSNKTYGMFLFFS